MAFSDLQTHIASDAGVQAIERYFAPVELFAHDFSDMRDRQYSGVKVPIYTLSAANEFNTNSNNWGGGDEIDGCVVPLDNHPIKVISIDDVAKDDSATPSKYTSFGQNSIKNCLKNSTEAVTNKVAKAVNNSIFGKLTLANLSAVAGSTTNLSVAAPTDYAGFGGLVEKTLGETYGQVAADIENTVVALGPVAWGNLVKSLEYSKTGDPRDVRTATVIPGLFGFKAFIRVSGLGSGIKGAVIPDQCLAIVNRVNYSLDGGSGYWNTWQATTDSGMTVGYRVYEDLAKGQLKLGCDCLVGSKITQKGIYLLA